MRTLGWTLVCSAVISAIAGFSWSLVRITWAFADANAGPNGVRPEELATRISDSLGASAVGLVLAVVLVVAGFLTLRSSRTVA